MSLLNVGLLSKNIGDGNGDNRDNSQIFVRNEGGGRKSKYGKGGHGSQGPKKCDRKSDCD